MRVILPTYNLNKCFIGSFSCSQETDLELIRLNHSIVHYSNGVLTLLDRQASYGFEVPESSQFFFEELYEYDVIEIFENGTVLLQFSEYSDDNTLFITSQCNSNCRMCPSSDYSRCEGVIPEPDEILEIARHYTQAARHITITGGEPFLFRDSMFEVLSYFKDNLPNTDFLILTNGRIFCLDKYVDLLITTQPNHITLAIPVHGSTSELHDFITQTPGSFDQTLSGITKLLASNIPVELRIVVSKYNTHDISNIARLIISTIPTVYRVHFIGLEMLGNAARNRNEVWLPYRDAFEAVKQSVDMLVLAGINVGLYNFPLCAVDQHYWPIAHKSISNYKRKFPAPCERCKHNNICGGVFAGSLYLAEKDLQPFEE